jgi:hypothetical protein
MLRREMPEHTFLCQDLVNLSVPGNVFDIVNSVTVLQHLPGESQRTVLRLVRDSIRAGGFLVLLENTYDFSAPIVFPHTTQQWIRLVEDAGLHWCCSWGSNFEILIRIARSLMLSRAPRDVQNGMTETPVVFPEPVGKSQSARGRIVDALKTSIALLSFPLEWALHTVPLTHPTHAVMIFRK